MNKGMTRIRWLSEHRILPTLGEVTRDFVFDIPSGMARKYIEQGEAEEVIVKKQLKEEIKS